MRGCIIRWVGLATLVVGAPPPLWAQAAPRLTRPPEITTPAIAAYPAEAVAAGLEGPVDLWVDLDETGAIVRVEVTRAPAPALAVAALEALVQTGFAAAWVDDVPTAVRIAYTYHFKLPTPPPAAPLPQPFTPPPALPAPGAEATPYAPYTTTVRDRRAPYDVSRQELKRDMWRGVPGVFGDPLRVVETLPGLGRAPFSSGILVMRGSSPDDSGVYLDGHAMPLLYHFGGGPSVLPPDAVGSIDVEPGSFGARYGRATAGIVDVTSRAGATDGMHGVAHASILDAGLSVEGPIANTGSYRAAARRSYFDILLPLANRALGQAPGTSLTLVPRYNDYFLRSDWRLSEAVTLIITSQGANDALSFGAHPPAFNLPASLNLQTTSHRFNPRLLIDLGHTMTLDLSPLVSWTHIGGQTPLSFSDLTTLSQALRAELRAQPLPSMGATVGVDVARNSHSFTAQIPTAPSRDFPGITRAKSSNVPGRLTMVHVGVFAAADISLAGWRLLPGVRFEDDAYDGRQRRAVEPRLAARLPLVDGLAIKAAFGTYHRLPLPDELAPSTGNPDLAFERSVQSAAGAEWALSDVHSIDVQAYYKTMDALTEPTAALAITPRGATPQRYVSQGQGRAVGAEVLLRRKLSHGVMGWVSYSVSRSERKKAPTDSWQLYARDQTHNVSTVLTVELPWAMHVGGRFRYVTGYPVRPIVGALFDADGGGYTPQSATTVERLPTFMQLDLRIDKLFGQPDQLNVLLFVDVLNVTNRQNAEYYQYSQDYSQRYAFPGLPFLPSLGVEVTF